MTRLVRSALFAALIVLAPGLSHGEPPAGTWTQIDEEDGIKIWRLDIPGKDLPGFKGETVIPRSSEDIITELKQVEHHTEWMYRCAQSEIIQHVSDEHLVIYNRVDVPWPIKDRDVILDTAFHAESERMVVLTFKNHDPKLRPLPERVVRMPKLEGFYRLWKMTPTRTKIVYQVEADVGGAVPKWIAARVAKEMPYETLSALRKWVMRRHPQQ
jgi:hypothetical protein